MPDEGIVNNKPVISRFARGSQHGELSGCEYTAVELRMYTFKIEVQSRRGKVPSLEGEGGEFPQGVEDAPGA